MSEFVDTPMNSEFVKKPEGYKGGAGTYDGDDCPGFAEHRRTSSPNGVPELIFDKSIKAPSGESDQF